MPLKPGKGLAHYRIERLIGQGGMGAVFLAQDTKLHRKVALKVLPGDVASHGDRLARFRREAHAVAALNHPNIVTIHSVEEAEGTHFLTMEWVEGKPLDQVLAAGVLPVPRVLDIGMALADALSAAHDRGIVHRDLKPANVMVMKGGRVKVLDFGLAKLLQTAASPEQSTKLLVSLTEQGMVVGTVPYMSPEQLSGQEVDARSDIFSLGVVLYELATGRRPFSGKTSAELVSSILRDPPAPVMLIREDLPRELGRIIAHCLQKDPEERFQSARDIRNELRQLREELTSAAQETVGDAPVRLRSSVPWKRWVGVVVAALILVGVGSVWVTRRDRGGESGAGAKQTAEVASTTPDKVASIAVLPFANMSADAENEYFSDGLTEELLNALAKNPSLRVAARTSSFSFKGKDVDIAEIGRRLNVEKLLEGSVRKEGDRVRITVQLINVADGYHLWSETYDRQLQSIFAVQDDITRSVMSSLKASFPEPGPTGARDANIDAYNLVLKGDYIVKRSGPGDLERARDVYQEALVLDPGYGRAWLGLGIAYGIMLETLSLPREEGLALSRGAYERALALDNSLAEAHAGLGWLRLGYEWDWAGAEAELAKALALAPANSFALGLAAALASVDGRLAEASELWRRFLEVDPLDAIGYSNAAICLYQEGRLDEALRTAQTSLEISPQREGTHAIISGILLAQGKADESLQECLQESSEQARLYGLVEAYHALGRRAESDAALSSYIDKFRDVRPFFVACLHAYRGQSDEAFEWLDRAYAMRDRDLAWVKVEPDLQSLREDSRWLPILQKMGLVG